MTISDDIKANQEAALETVRKVAESLPGFTFASESAKMGADPPDAVNVEQALTQTVRVHGGPR